MDRLRSGFERTIVSQLKARSVAYEYEPVKVPYTLSYNYLPDLKLSNGIFIELKGYLRPTDVAKLRAVKAQHPDLDLRLVFMDASKKLRGNTTYAKWAERQGFQWADGAIPQEWIDE